MVGPASLRAGGPFKELSPIEAGASTLGYEPGRERKQPMSTQDSWCPKYFLLLGRRRGGGLGWGAAPPANAGVYKCRRHRKQS